MKTVYLYDRATGQFISDYSCPESPLEPGEYFIPVDCVSFAPSIQVGYWPVLAVDSWVNIEDHRGATVYDTTTGFPETITDLGQIPADKSLIPRPADYYAWNGSAWVEDAILKRAAMSAPAWAIRRALTQMGLRAATEQAVAQADQDTKDMWEFATSYHRTNPFTLVIANALNKTDADLDELFTIAKQIEDSSNGN